MKNLANLRLVAALILTILIIIVFVSACNLLGGQEPAQTGPAESGILAPPDNIKALAGGPIQVQSAFVEGDQVSRVELSVQAEGETTPTLIRADTPTNGLVTQEWVPDRPGRYTIFVKPIDASGQPLQGATGFTRQIEVIEATVLVPRAIAEGAPGGDQFTAPVPTRLWATPVATPEFVAESADDDDAAAAFVVETSTDTEEAVAPPAPRYPPPPPAPGVPPGPTQKQIPPFNPPICDNAEYMGPFVPDPSLRVGVSEDDNIAAKAIAGSTVHRIWQIRNIGTCTWGPGYELAFYGGRAMGSGGVAFEAAYPVEPGRRNVLIDTNRIIVPEGKPNQTAKLEVLLNLPVTPGIHQSYWRMRNPHGVYFGPIVGVTFEVVRECEFNLYGAPFINKFEIVGIGNVFEPQPDENVPDDIKTFQAIFTEPIVVEWDIINATNFDLVITDRLGKVVTKSSPRNRDTASYTPTTLGPHTFTLFADNGSCTFEQQVIVDVIPPAGDQFRLDLILPSAAGTVRVSDNLSYSSTVAANQAKIQWEHFDSNVNEVTLFATLYKLSTRRNCPVVDSIFGWEGHCTERQEWQVVSGVPPIELPVGPPSGESRAAGTATVANVEQKLCQAVMVSGAEKLGIKYVLEARIDGRPAEPPTSNEVDVECTPTSRLRTEIPGAGASGGFTPQNQ
ncbi:MAG: NBR1-Ig-like domain-containing protein [Anaerolineae bacterium]|nr:NBR1-Ig-like domain-containing protein [Anaerolineae bacterium]